METEYAPDLLILLLKFPGAMEAKNKKTGRSPFSNVNYSESLKLF